MVVNLGLPVKQQRILNTCERIGACISILCSLWIIVTVSCSKYYKCRIYHRIMMCCSINIILLNITHLWGSAAIPKNYQSPYVDEYGNQHIIAGARGNITTCTVEGILDYISQFAVPFYYVALSLLSLAAVVYRFNLKDYMWIEKYIHVSVYAVPLGSGLYLLSKDAFNPSIRTCHLVSIPVGCGDESNYEIECIRGPQNISQLQNIFMIIPFLFIIIFPAFIMSIVYYKVRFCSGPRGRIVANSVAKQSGLYLFALYWIYFFKIIDESLISRAGKYIFVTNVLSNTSQTLLGLWTLLVYKYFKSDDPTKFVMY